MAMHQDQLDAVRPDPASRLVPLVLEEFEAATTATARAARIKVMVASAGDVLGAPSQAMLACAADIEITHRPELDATGLATSVEHHLPGVLLLDKTMLERLDPQSLLRIRAQCPRVRVLLLWDGICRNVVADVLRNGFQGFIPAPCPPDVCLKAIRAVSHGELWLSRASMAMAIADLLQFPVHVDSAAPAPALHVDAREVLTPREMQVVALLRQGRINKEIARELGIMEDTVKKHLQSVFAKLGVHRRALVALRSLPGGYGAGHGIP